MEALHDEVTVRLRRIRTLAGSCTFTDADTGPRDALAPACRLTPELDLRDDYAFRLRLPVLRASVAGDKTPSDIHAAIIAQHVRDVSRRRCERNLEDPGCLLESQIEELRKKL